MTSLKWEKLYMKHYNFFQQLFFVATGTEVFNAIGVQRLSKHLLK